MTASNQVNRRDFAKKLALTPFGVAVSRSMLSQATVSDFSEGGQIEPTATTNEQINPAPRKRVPKTAAEYNKHPPVHETPPFEGPVSFERREIAPRVRSFAPNEILLDIGPCQDARDWNRAYMMRLPNDRLLHNFRLTVGLPSEAQPLGGWEAPKSELRGHFVGHYLSAAALLYSSTGDRAIKGKADDLVKAIAECQAKIDSKGYVSAFPEELFVRLDKREKVWAPFYTLHKIMAGLLDMHVYAESHKALDVLLKLADWVDTWTAARTEGHMQEILMTEYGGMNDVLYRLAGVTKDDRWARTGDRFTKRIFFNPLAMRQDQLKGLHANTHMPQVIGAATRYELSSDTRFRNVAQFFWETIAESRTYATGGSANTESWLTNANHLSLELKASSHHQECCCAYNMMKLSRQLFSWTGDVRYIDYYERNLFNHRLGTIEAGTGLTTYFLSMSPGAWKTTCTEDQTFWCCTGTALEEFAKLNDTIYFRGEKDVYVNLFIPSRLRWKERGIQIKQVTEFPNSNRTLLIIENTPSEEWTLYLRVPSWTSSANSLRVNDEQVRLAGQPGSFIAITRTWKHGDRIDFVLPMKLSAEPLPDDPAQQAFLYGPIVLAAQFQKSEIDFDLQHNQGPEIQELPPLKIPTIESKGLPIDEWLVPVPGSPLTFRTSRQARDTLFKPLNQSWQRFAAYMEVT